jgi:monofunctional biosynthetic peptidoglycan transglycosylase
MTATDKGLLFHGTLSLQNNGGFASTRSHVSEDMTGSLGVRLTVRGDGRKYQLRLRKGRDFSGVAWRHEFSTDGSIQRLELKYADFEPVFRGRLVRSAGPVVPGQITQIGFLIADKAEGEFSLSILKVEAMR